MVYELDLMKTTQPYFVMSTDCFYQGIVSDFGISHFYNYQLENDTDATIVVPDGCIDVIFVYDDNAITAKVCGTVLKQSYLFQDSKKSYFGIRFAPGVLPALFDVSRSELINEQIDIEQICLDRELLHKVYEARTFEQKKEVFLQSYFTCFQKAKQENTKQILATAIKQMIFQTAGDVKVKELEAFSGYTSRYIDKIIKEETGLSTKSFCNIIKFQKILNRLSHDTTTKLSDLAVSFGYYDQAHFIRSFRVNTGMTPKEYRNMILKKEYAKRLVNV